MLFLPAIASTLEGAPRALVAHQVEAHGLP